MTDGDSRLDSQLNIAKNMEDFLLYGRNLKELQENLEKFLSFASEKNLKLKTKKFIIGSQVEFRGCVLTAEKIRNEELIFIAPKGKRIKAFEELRKLQNKHDCHPLMKRNLLD